MLKTIREGKSSPPVCPDCGCRLNFVVFDKDTSFAHHFSGTDESRDARGHTCRNIGVVWDISNLSNVRTNVRTWEAF